MRTMMVLVKPKSLTSILSTPRARGRCFSRVSFRVIQ